MMAPCEVCGWDDTVEYIYPKPGDRDYDRLYNNPRSNFCECIECGARYEIETDGDYDDGWRDTSQPGDRIPGPLKENFERYTA